MVPEMVELGSVHYNLTTWRWVVILVFHQDKTKSKAEGNHTGDDEESGYDDKTAL